MATTEITKVVVYWAECGDDKGYCYAVHSVTDDREEIDSAIIPNGQQMTEAEAVTWVEARYPDAAIEIGEDDIV